MNLVRYLMQSRGPGNTLRRLPAIARRFGLSPARMEEALQAFVAITDAQHCRPTLAVTAVLLERYPKVFQRLHEAAELAVHGYVHTDYSQLDEATQAEHMERALRAFHSLNIWPRGFRCPYLRWNEQSFHVANRFGLTYGSNRALAWEAVPPESASPQGWSAYEKGLRLYGARPASQYLSLPSRINGSLLDIPASLPDDEAMVDRLGLDADSRMKVWTAMLEEVYRRGELLTLTLHHERVRLCGQALEVVLQRCREFSPPVYVASLEEIVQWWSRRLTFSLEAEPVAEDLYRVIAPEEEGLTVLVRGAETDPASGPWYGAYRVAPPGNFVMRSQTPPVVALEKNNPPALKEFLQEEGFVVWGDESGGFHVGGFQSFGEKDKRKVLDLIESSDAPLARIWRWPNGARCALSVTGDVDAMTLVDFLRRPLEV